MEPRESPSHLVVGVLGRAVGLTGEIEVRVESDDPLRFAAGSVLYLQGDLRPLTIADLRQRQSRTIVRFGEVGDRSAAESLRGRVLVVPREAARRLGPGEYWDEDLIGCAVVTVGGRDLGSVTDVLHGPTQDVIEVSGPKGPMFPLVRGVVVEVSVEARRIVVDPPPGWLED